MSRVTDRHSPWITLTSRKTWPDIHFANAKTIVWSRIISTSTTRLHFMKRSLQPRPGDWSSAFEWRYTPKHGSWLNLAESEIGVPIMPVPRPPHPRQTNPHRRNRRLGAPPKCPTRQGQLALHKPRNARNQTQASLPFNLTESGD